MFKEITLENFFSFAEPTTIQLNKGVNVLVGINGSGKTNFLRALRLIGEFSFGEGDMDDLVLKEWGGFQKMVNYAGGKKKSIRVGYQYGKANDDIFIKPIGLNNYKINADYKHLNAKGEKGWNYRYDGDTLFIFRKEGEKELGPFRLSQFLRNRPTDSKLEDSIKRMENFLVWYEQFDISRHGPIRKIAEYDNQERLRFDGSNLVMLLNRLKNHHAIAYDKLVDSLKEVNPNFKDISFELIGSNVLLSLREKNLDRSVSMEHISDGTLRYLLLLVILLNPERGQVICLDEPEIGLHPDMIQSVARLIKEAAAQGTQFFIATHSPLLLNAFELEDIIVFEKDKDNKTVVRQPSEEDFEEEGGVKLPGFLWMQGKIGGKRW